MKLLWKIVLFAVGVLILVVVVGLLAQPDVVKNAINSTFGAALDAIGFTRFDLIQ